MADKKKSILDEALLDAKRIQEALNANSKEILRSVTKEEIDSLVKESLKEDYTEEDVEAELDGSEETDAVDADVPVDDMDVDAVAPVGDDAEAEVELDVEPEGEIEDLETGDDLEGDYDSSMDAVASDDEVEMDMTMASDEDVISVYKKLTGDDEIEVVIDDEAGEVKLTVNEPGEFVIKTGDSSPEVDADLDDLDDLGGLDDMGADDMGDMDVDVDALDVDAGAEIDAVDAVGMDADMGADDAAMDVDAGELGDEEKNEVLYEIALDEDTKIGNTANGKVRTATSDVSSSMGGDLATGDIEGQKAKGTEGADQFGGKTTDEGGDLGFEENQKYANAEGPMVMAEDDVDENLEEGDDLTETDDVAEGDVDEQISVNRVAQNRAGGDLTDIKGPGAKQGAKVNESKVIKKYNTLLTEAKELKGKNAEYKQALKQFRTMLAETVVFNANLTYVTKLFMEHSTSKGEKQGIFERFDNEVSTLKESKKLYKTIASELGSRKPMTESVGDKMNKEVTSSSSKQLNESTVYVDKETSRIMDLMKRVDKK